MTRPAATVPERLGTIQNDPGQPRTVLMTTLAPLFVSDVRDDDYWRSVDKAHGDALRAWLRSNALEPNDIYRFEVYLLDTLFAKVFTYARDEHGRLRIVEGELVQCEPFLAPLNSTPPPCVPESDSEPVRASGHQDDPTKPPAATTGPCTHSSRPTSHGG